MDGALHGFSIKDYPRKDFMEYREDKVDGFMTRYKAEGTENVLNKAGVEISVV